MAITFILFIALVTVANGNITGRTPRNGACLCFTANSVKIRSSACGHPACGHSACGHSACGHPVIGSANTGQCFRYTGSNTRCYLNNMNYQFFRINYDGKQGWAVGDYLNLASDSRCASPGVIPPTNGNEYTCQVTDLGKRVHESSSKTPHDCVDTRCQNTCKGGQCIAYVKCRCTKNGKYPPQTTGWEPGQKVKTADGKCNRNIAPNTAIATFTSSNGYDGHAAVFIRCTDDYTVQVYDQWCGESVGYRSYSLSSRYGRFATITSSSDGPVSISCRSEISGPTPCPETVPVCKSSYKLL